MHPLLILLLCIVAVLVIKVSYTVSSEGFSSTPSYKLSTEYKKQVELLSNTYSGSASGKRPLQASIGSDMPESEQIFTNFYSLGCRFTGFIGPMDNSYYDPDIAVQQAVATGCRTFILEIDYIEECDKSKFFPTLVVRDIHGRLIVESESNKPKCNSVDNSNINSTCKAINTYAFADSCQNNTDPVVLVLYFLAQPPGSYNSPTVLQYFSNVAKMIAPLSSHFLGSEPTGLYNRQSQEGQLLINKMSDYKNKVLVFTNANTSGFRENNTYASTDDLDHLVNLRLSYTQTKLGITDNTSGSTFGILESTDDFMTIPTDRADKIINDTKLKWTICLSKDPFKSVSEATYKKITNTYGVHCIPIILHDIPANQYMFTDKLFQKYGFIPKPKALRYVKPPVVVPAEPSPTINAHKGALRNTTTTMS